MRIVDECGHQLIGPVRVFRGSISSHIMPPNLHPRSRLTSSLFATTLFASFFVVALPHILPCPAPRIAYADGEMQDGQQRKRRRRRKCVDEVDGAGKNKEAGAGIGAGVVEESADEEDEGLGERKSKRECPVPKPRGVVGELLGFRGGNGGGREGSSTGEGSSKPP
ncbi:hypothetical protein LCER1_G002281 [Lachnellula cervina]|uniref:Uncharacterized protein n=1 Tax=Lachnellula cervina TaxID=1316786 RepID=A0A7D8UQ99_9HELO|nr:hypothetical protein LCER1_G002281 [Lachnellula cervina]